jgi:hypothetical protein
MCYDVQTRTQHPQHDKFASFINIESDYDNQHARPETCLFLRHSCYEVLIGHQYLQFYVVTAIALLLELRSPSELYALFVGNANNERVIA